jgi:hypothetical protein
MGTMEPLVVAEAFRPPSTDLMATNEWIARET